MSVGKFIRDNWKFVVVATIVLSLIAAVLTLLLPRDYTRQMSLAVRVAPIALSEGFQPLIVNPAEAPNLAVAYLQDADYEGTSIVPSYNIRTQQIDVTLRSKDRAALENVGTELTRTVEEGFEGVYDETLTTAIETRISVLEIEIRSEKEALKLLEKEISEISGGSPEKLDDRTLVQLGGLEGTRVASSSEIERLKVEADRLKQAREDPAKFNLEPVTVGVAQEGDIFESGSPATTIVLAAMVSFVIAVAVALARTAFKTVKENGD